MFTGDQKSSHGAFSSSDQKWHEDICNNEWLLSEDYFLERGITIAPYLHYEQIYVNISYSLKTKNVCSSHDKHAFINIFIILESTSKQN